MAIQIDYFIAASDDDASASLRFGAGPRSEWADVVATQDIDPGLGLGYLNEILSGTPVDSFLATSGPSLVAVSEDEQKLLLELDTKLVARIASVPEPFDDIADQWARHTAPSQADAWAPRRADLVEFLRAFVPLATRSVEGEGALYCWLWP